MIHPISIAAHNLQHVSQVLAELLQGESRTCRRVDRRTPPSTDQWFTDWTLLHRR